MDKLILKNGENNGLISEDGKSLSGNSGGYWGVATLGDRQISEGKHRFAFRYDGGMTGIGVATVDSNLNGYWIVGKNDPTKQRGLCIASDDFVNASAGLKYPDAISYCKGFSAGDIIEMEIDFEKGVMEYFKNGTSLGVCFNDLNKLPKPLYVVACAVVVGTTGKLTVTEVVPTPNPIAVNLTATAGDAKVTLDWNGVERATGYTVKRSTKAGGPYTVIATNVSILNYSDATVANGTTYYYVVTAVTTTGESGNSNEASATPNAGTVSPQTGGNVLLRVVLIDSSEREYLLKSEDVNAFISWYNRTVNTGNTCYKFADLIDGSTEYLAFEKIISFKTLTLK